MARSWQRPTGAGDLGPRAFCELAASAVTTFDYSLRRDSERLHKKQGLLPVVVRVEPEESQVPEITVLARNGRRVEVRRGCEAVFAIAELAPFVVALVHFHSRALAFGCGTSRRLLRDALLPLSSGFLHLLFGRRPWLHFSPTPTHGARRGGKLCG